MMSTSLFSTEYSVVLIVSGFVFEIGMLSCEADLVGELVKRLTVNSCKEAASF